MGLKKLCCYHLRSLWFNWHVKKILSATEFSAAFLDYFQNPVEIFFNTGSQMHKLGGGGGEKEKTQPFIFFL